jgi:hypothetical protein
MRQMLYRSWWVGVLACTQAAPSQPATMAPASLRLFFMGNSLTYTFDIPSQVKRMAVAAGFDTPVIETSLYANYALEDHWTLSTARQDLASTHYDVLIMQQGPSTLTESGIDLTKWAGTWADFARVNGTRPAMFAVWPPLGGNLDSGVAHYEAAASAANTGLYPVGEAWREAWHAMPSIPLYGPDRFHPSEHGAWLAALVISSIIFDKPSSAFPNLFPGVITADQEVILRAAATTAIQRYGRR